MACGDGVSPADRPILITGAAGFIGAALAERLLQRGERVLGLDNLNPYYSPGLRWTVFSGQAPSLACEAGYRP